MSQEKKQDPSEVLSAQKSSINGLSGDEATRRLSEFGENKLEEKHESKWKRLFKSFWGPIPWMIEIAAILSILIKHWADFFIIMFMLVLNALIEFFQSNQAQSALEALKASMALKARVKRDGAWVDIDASSIVPGDVIQIKNGDILPADVVMLDGEYISIDQAALTGESLPVNKGVGDSGYSGSVVKQGYMVAVVTSTGKNTFFGKTAGLVQSAGNISHFQQSVMNIGKFLIYGALFLSVIIIASELYRNDNPLNLIEMVLVLVVASIPVAMPAVMSVTMALGALALSKKGAIVSRLQAIEEMAGVDILCSDKTGTLTKNQLKLGDPIVYGGFSKDDIVLYGSLASEPEGDDAIDKAIIVECDKDIFSSYKKIRFIPFDPVGKKTEGFVEKDGVQYHFIKGAPKVVIEQCSEDEALKQKALADVDMLASKGLRALGVAKEENGSFRLVGILSLFDPPRDDSKETIASAKTYGIGVRMVTGDDVAIAREISGQLGLGTNIRAADTVFKEGESVEHLPSATMDSIEKAEGFARVFPEHKYAIVKALQDRNHIIAMTGDGVNDAPALKQADVGIAVSGATDAARGAADLILTKPGLSVITDAVEESRKIFQRMISYVNYRVAMTINIMLFVTASIVFTGFEPLSAVMIILLALLDDIPIMTIAYDNTDSSQSPVKWDLIRVLSVASVLGVVSVAQSFGLLYMADRYFHDGGHVQTMLFLQLVVAGHLLLFIARHRSYFWLKPYPSLKVLGAIFGTQIIAVIICKFGIFVEAISWEAIGFVWIYAIVWMFILNIIRISVEKSFDKRTCGDRFALLNKRAG